MVRFSSLFMALLPVGVMANPVGMVANINQLLICLVVIGLIGVAWKYKDRVIYLFTGDDRLHGNGLDLFWWMFMRCFGTCDGSWCVPVFGVNIKKKIGQQLGLVTIPLKISNIRAGDLAFEGVGDFYLTCECGTHPPMITSVQENSSGKVITFPEELTLRIRDSVMEDRVRFYVKEENVFGSEEIAHLTMQASEIFNMLDEHDHEKPGVPFIRRFKMEPASGNHDYETPPWLILEISRDVDTALQKLDLPQHLGHTVTLMDRSTGIYHDLTPGDMKEQYGLIDAQGRSANEPAEEMLADMRAFRKRVNLQRKIIVGLFFFAFIGYGLFRFYVWSCYRQFENLERAKLLKKEFPLSAQQLSEVRHQCKGVSTEQCNPAFDQVYQTCLLIPEGQRRPRAFRALWMDLVGIDAPDLLTPPCFHGVCKVREQLSGFDVQAMIGAVVLLFGAMVFNESSKKRLKEKNAEMIKMMKEGKKHRPQQAGGWGF